MKNRIRIAIKEWKEEAVKRYGEDRMEWVFKCPSCGVHTKYKEWVEDENGVNMIAFSCIGRIRDKKYNAFSSDKKQPCNYAGGGLFRINPIVIIDDEGIEHELFDFAMNPLCEKEEIKKDNNK